jgi:glycosyltransferase involved in cell wall biosynthesis
VRVLFLTTETSGFGGVQYAGRLLARAVRDSLGREVELTVLSLNDSAADLRRLDPACRPVAASASRLRLVLACFRLSRQCWDLVLLGHVNLAPLVFLFRARRSPILGVVYGLEGWRPIRGLARLGLLRIAQVLFISQHTQTLTELANPWLRRVHGFVCHLGLLPSVEGSGARGQGSGVRSQESEKKQATPISLTPDPFALCIGRMSAQERYKGHEELIRVWPRVRRERAGLRLVFIGDGDDRPRLQQLAAATSDGIEFLGAVDDAVRDSHLGECRCFLLPARGEGLGLVFLEAMRLAKPVLSGDKDAGREVVLDGVTGRTVDPSDEGQLLQGVLDVSGPRAQAMGAAGRQRFEHHFAYPVFLKRFSEHLDELLRGCGVARTSREAVPR